MKWARQHEGGYECSSKGDSRFSAFFAFVVLPDGSRVTIEQAYQCNIKGYASINQGKGNPPLHPYTRAALWAQYKELWRIYLRQNPELLKELLALPCGTVLTDMFATSDINQARALGELVEELNLELILNGSL